MVLAAATAMWTSVVVLPALAGPGQTHGWKTTVLVEGAPLKGGSNGLAFDAGDALYVANVFGGTISIIDPDSGELLDQLGASQGIVAPDDLHFGPDGSLFWTDLAIGAVSRRSAGAAGVVTSVDGTTTQVAAGIPAVNPITVTDDGRVFVAQCFAPATGLFEILDPYGEASSPLRTVLDGVPDCVSNGMDHTGGLLFTPRWFEDRILGIEAETATTIVEIATNHVPTAVKIQGRHLYWVSQETGGVYRADLAETPPVPRLLAELDRGLDNLAFDSQGRLFVSNAADGTIVEVLQDGSSRTVSAGGIIIPMGIGVIDNTVYIGDPLSVWGFERRTGGRVSLSTSVFGLGPLISARGLFRDGEHLILTSWPFGQVQVIDPVNGDAIAQASFDGGPLGATRFKGDLIIAEGFAGRVTRATGANLEYREIIAEVPGATGLAASDDDLYVTSQTEGEVWQIIRDGDVLTSPVVIATGLQGPEGIVMMGRHKLALVEVGTGSVHELNLRNGNIRTIATGLGFAPSPPGLVAFWFNGIDLDRRGDLYVNGDAANVIYKISRRR